MKRTITYNGNVIVDGRKVRSEDFRVPSNGRNKKGQEIDGGVYRTQQLEN